MLWHRIYSTQPSAELATAMLMPTAQVFWKRTRWQVNSWSGLMQTQLLREMMCSVWLPVGATLGSEFCTLCRAESSVNKNITCSVFVFIFHLMCFVGCFCFSLYCMIQGCRLAWRARTCWCVAAELRWSITKNGVRSGSGKDAFGRRMSSFCRFFVCFQAPAATAMKSWCQGQELRLKTSWCENSKTEK